MTLSFPNKKSLPSEICPPITSWIPQETLGSLCLPLETLRFIRLLISILKETFLIKVTKAHMLFLDATSFFSFSFWVRQFVLIRCKNHSWENYIICMLLAKETFDIVCAALP